MMFGWAWLSWQAHFQQNNKQNDRISDSANYSVLNHEYITTIKMFTYSVELTILFITYINVASY